jgi:hypothetical protein
MIRILLLGTVAAIILISLLAILTSTLDAYPILVIFPIAAWLAILAYGLSRPPR